MTRCLIVALLVAARASLDVFFFSLYCIRLASGSRSAPGPVVVDSCKCTSYVTDRSYAVLLTVHLNCMQWEGVSQRKQTARPILCSSFTFRNSKFLNMLIRKRGR